MTRGDHRSTVAVKPYATRGAFAPLLRACLCMTVAAFVLSACSFADGSDQSRGQAGAPGVATPAAPPVPTAMDTFRALAPPEGMKFTPLFAVQIRDEDARFMRLEQAVQSLRNDFDTVTPSMVRLVAVEKDIKDLVDQLRTLNDGGVVAEPAPVEPVSSTTILPTSPNNGIPGGDIAGGTEPAPARMAEAASNAPSSLVTPEAALAGQLPPEGAASPSSIAAAPPPAAPLQAPIDLTKPPAPPIAPLKPVLVPTPPAPPPVVVPVASPEPAPKKPEPKAAEAPKPPPAEPAPEKQAVAPEQVTEEAEPKAATASASSIAELPPVVVGTPVGDVKEIRIGDHIDRTRIVLEATAKGPYTAQIINGGKQLVIDLPQYNWQATRVWDAVSANLIAGYKYADNRIVFDLLSPAEIKGESFMTGSSGSGQRLVIDLFSADIHTP